MPRLLLVDGHSNLYRAFYGIKTPLSAPDGTPTAAAFGFLRMQHRMLRELQPSHVGVAFDVGGETFRSQMDARYKAHRPPMPDELRVQIPLTQRVLRLLGSAVLTQEGVEADDVIGTLAQHAAAAGFEVVIASSDKDLMQLVCDPSIRMFHTRHERLLDEQGVTEVFGVPPAQVGEVLAIMGDSSDNVPGCPGIGEKGALELIRQWGSLTAVYDHLDQVRPRLAKLLTEHRAEVELSRELVRIRCDLQLATSLDGLARQPEDRAALLELYRGLGFASLAAELAPAASLVTAAPTPVRTVDLEEITALLTGSGPIALACSGNNLAVAAAGQLVLLEAAVAEIGALLAPQLSRLWCHDAKQLLARMVAGGVQAAAVPRDAMLAGYLLAPGEAVDLVALCRRYALPPPALDSLAEHAAALHRLVPLLEAGLEREGLSTVFTELELPLVPVLEAMERRGIKLDLAVLSDLSARLGASLVELERDIYAEAGGPFNINSPTQLAEVLFERRGLPVLRKTAKTKAPSTDAEVLQELAVRGFRLPALLLEFREQAKLRSTYVDALPRQVGPDGRIHTSFNQAVASTGRLSSSDPNLQNIPVRSELGREVRRAFVAEPGHVLIAADYSQIELRVLAHMSGDPTLLAAFANNEDIHTATASLVFGVARELVGQEQRRAAKTINFGLIYGMGAFALGRDLGVPTREAQRFIDAYFERLPRVRDFMNGIKEQARHTGKVSTLFGRVRFITGLDASNQQVRGNAERQAINAPIQGTAADLIKRAMINLEHELIRHGGDARLVLQVHDELIVEAQGDHAARIAEVVKTVMQSVHPLRVPLVVDVGVADSWAAAKG